MIAEETALRFIRELRAAGLDCDEPFHLPRHAELDERCVQFHVDAPSTKGAYVEVLVGFGLDTIMITHTADGIGPAKRPARRGLGTYARAIERLARSL